MGRSLVTEVAGGEADEFFEVYIGDYGEDHAVGGVVADKEITQKLGGEGFDVLLGSEYVMRQRMTFEEILFKLVVDEVGGLVAVTVNLFDDDVFLVLYLVQGKLGIEKDVADVFRHSHT